MLLGELRRWAWPRAGPSGCCRMPTGRSSGRGRGDRDGEGFVIPAASPDRLANQGWKDSWDGIRFGDGGSPRRRSRVRGAGLRLCRYLARAHFAREGGDGRPAGSGTTGRHRSATRSTVASGCPTGAGSPWASTPTSDRSTRSLEQGHCLWTGIVDEDKARSVADALLIAGHVRVGVCERWPPTSGVQPGELPLRLGGRTTTLDRRRARSLRLGSTTPTDHEGNPRRGRRQPGRLPELFSGIGRDELACRPPTHLVRASAWAAATP